MATIKYIRAHEIIDSRGTPTIEGQLTLDNGLSVTTAMPSGTSIGTHEAVELRDNDKARFGGMGVTKACAYINDLIGPKLVGVSPEKQQEVDAWLLKADGTNNKSSLGSNTTLTISQLMTKAAAAAQGVSIFTYVNSLYNSVFKDDLKVTKIPAPLFSMINGGKHAHNNIEFQEFHVIPSSSLSFSKAYQMGVEFFQELQKVLIYRNATTSVGEEGGYSPNFSTNTDALEVLKETIMQMGLKMGLDIFIGIDVAASNFYKDDRYIIRDKPHPLKRDEYIAFIQSLTSKYSILNLEDPLYEDDWEGWKKLYSTLPEQVYLVGDDLITTNKTRLTRAIDEQICSTVLVKPNQIGTIIETLEVINIARKHNFNYIVSHRSGETNDDFISDFAVGIQADFVKFGAPSRGERIAKYNRLWTIEREELKLA